MLLEVSAAVSILNIICVAGTLLLHTNMMQVVMS